MTPIDATERVQLQPKYQEMERDWFDRLMDLDDRWLLGFCLFAFFALMLFQAVR